MNALLDLARRRRGLLIAGLYVLAGFAIVLLLLRRPVAVGIVALAALPWTAGWYLATIRDNPSSAAGWGVAAGVACVVGAVILVALRRSGVRIVVERPEGAAREVR